MNEMLIYPASIPEAQVQALVDALKRAVPAVEPVVDATRALAILSSPRAVAAYDAGDEAATVTRSGELANVVALVLPVIASTAVKAAVDAGIEWLRTLRGDRESSQTLLIFGPNGQPLKKIRLTASSEPEISAPPWPAP